MYLVIAEKPSVSRAIAEVIGAQEREDGYLKGADCMVSWCFDIWSSMFHRMLTMRNLASGDMKISRSSRKTGKLQSQKIRKISSIS